MSHPDAPTLTEHLPILQVVVPLVTAPLCVALRRARLAYALTLIVVWTSFAISVLLLVRTLEGGAMSYALGSWPPPIGIELRIGPLNAFVLAVVTSIAGMVLTASRAGLLEEVPADRRHFFYAAYLLCMSGLAGIASAGDAFNIFVFLEISSLAAYALVALGRTRRALTAAFQYLVMGTLGGTFLLLGIGMLYMVTGTLNLADLAERLPVDGNRTVLVAMAVITVGAGIKMAFFPLHGWLPNAYTYAPALVTAFLAGTATKVAYYVSLTFLFRVFGTELAFGQLHLDAVLLPLAVAAIFVASAVAVFERDLKRLLAFSSVAQIGYMVIGVALASTTGLAGGIVHIFNHGAVKSGLFLAVAAFVLRTGSSRIDDLAGLGRRMPWTSAAFVVGGLGLIGVPLTTGFVSKWLLVAGALEEGLWAVAVLVLLSSLLALVYVGKVVEVLYFREPPAGFEAGEAPLGLVVPTCVLAGATLVFGVFTQPTVRVAQRAAELLMAGGL